MPTITFREYNPRTGAFIGNVSSLSFGNMAAGSHSATKVVDIAFTDVVSVDNVKIGVVNDGGITMADDSGDINADGSATNGRIGIEHTTAFVADKTVARHFAGVNTNGAANNEYNVEVGTRNETTSQFVYLDIQPGTNSEGSGSIVYKVFFDFS